MFVQFNLNLISDMPKLFNCVRVQFVDCLHQSCSKCLQSIDKLNLHTLIKLKQKRKEKSQNKKFKSEREREREVGAGELDSHTIKKR
ncbi:hypothetical protein BpHYR1_015013 [Brachionus plicatilis]|uniref:Uncharacterized protein n=1 Tax=Brachionus plicatilis TaxID=10195 RepID=A0A3M7T497_BRAPC|nr:hypothetical protein BpHYR1_015013 [Brachionus plicatilis]